MIATMRALGADLLVVAGVAVATLAVIGLIRLPDPFTKIHSASKAVVLGVAAILVASLVVNDLTHATRALLVATFLLLTSPVGSHALARLEHLTRRQRPRS